jgi:hypothetical protein
VVQALANGVPPYINFQAWQTPAAEASVVDEDRAEAAFESVARSVVSVLLLRVRTSPCLTAPFHLLNHLHTSALMQHPLKTLTCACGARSQLLACSQTLHSAEGPEWGADTDRSWQWVCMGL